MLSAVGVAVGCRGHAHYFVEQTGEVVGVVKTEFGGNLVYIHVGGVEHLTCGLYLDEIEVGYRGVADGAFEDGGEMIGGVSGELCEL